MVSFQAVNNSPNGKQAAAIPEFGNSSKKRKCEDSKAEAVLFDKRSKAAESTKSIFDIELHLETPLPLEWQQCLDIQSGKIYFYNTKTHIRTTKDPRGNQEAENTGDHMSLDLELNLQSGSPERFMDSCRYSKKNSEGVARSPSWLAVGGDQEEMVASVCSRCHMLVMMSKSSPACPNCKFLHPPDQSPPRLFKQRLTLFC
ncbi:hypothetical protein HS088_TW11G00293 [Tripterygium wilfordii]|uniref:WW domain-containing protein n=1 Tax=Tripterygium wilfordii TaxID=458696 RepID=A0A7J7D1K5_TRIWF|nr:uncharacterized protein LOC120009138 [Tripterygium wilfordii]KAF5740227.1 hypothetical protein HS088_TW11G00293 [Tripterygium wilfordii]